MVLAYPYPDVLGNAWTDYFFPARSLMLDQAMGGMRFKLIGGYGYFPSPTSRFGTVSPALLEPQSVQALFDAEFTHAASPQQQSLLARGGLTSGLRDFIRKFHVDSVVVVPTGGHPVGLISQMTTAFGPPVESGGVIVWAHLDQRMASQLESSRVSMARSGSMGR